MRRNRNAKIVATLGPANSSLEAVRSLFEAGADVFRLDFSHGSHADHQARPGTIREVERQAGWPIGVLADLQGPEVEGVRAMVDHACAVALEQEFGRPGNIVATAAGMPFGAPGTTNLLRIARLQRASST